MRASPALFNRFRADMRTLRIGSIEATKLEDMSVGPLLPWYQRRRVPGRGIGSTGTIQAGVGRLRLGVAVTAHPGLYGAGGRGGLASPIAVNRLDQSRGWKADYTGSAAF